MASFDINRPMADGHLSGVRLSTLFSRISAALADWNDARKTRNALSKLSDHELNDLGLNRGDIDAMYSVRPRF